MRVTMDDRDFIIETRHKTWPSAVSSILYNYLFPPQGYKLLNAKVRRRARSGKGGGRSCNVVMGFMYCDERVTPMSLEDVYDLFKAEPDMQSEMLSERVIKE